MTAPLNQTVSYVLKNKALVQAHQRRHETTWGPSPPLSHNEDAPVKVYIRTRPLLPADHAVKAYPLVTVQPHRTIHFTHPTVRSAGGRFATKSFVADGVFDLTATNDELCNGMHITGLLDECIAPGGKNVAILAYGQTGTGKTYSTTAIEERIISHLFAIEHAVASISAVTISAFELRGSSLYDLLSDPPLAPVKLQTSSSGDFIYQGLNMVTVENMQHALELATKAKDLRLTRSTEKNSVSSRSHSVLSISIRTSDGGEASTITVIDLAGSERSHHMVRNDAERVKEAIETNKSLAVLKDCIRSRLDPNFTHAPWRGSRLTMILKGAFQSSRQADSPTRTSRLVILACISPSPLDAEDTLNTLRYVAIFRLSARDFEGGFEVKGRAGTTLSDDAKQWDHDESLAYISRNLPKLAPLVHRLLPTSDSTISDLFGLSSLALGQLCATPSHGELSKQPGIRVPDARTVSQAKSWLDVYNKKLKDLAQKSELATTSSINSRMPVNSSTVTGILDALNGKDTKADETGVVTKVDWSGTVRYE